VPLESGTPASYLWATYWPPENWQFSYYLGHGPGPFVSHFLREGHITYKRQHPRRNNPRKKDNKILKNYNLMLNKQLVTVGLPQAELVLKKMISIHIY